MGDDDRIEIEADGDVAALVAQMFGSRELRNLASNAGVSRERGDTKGETARRIVDQDPALAARILENAHPLDAPCDCGPFKERREVGEETISLDEARRRARHKGMRLKLKSLARTLDRAHYYEAEISWEYNHKIEDDSGHVDRRAGYHPRSTSVTVKREPGAPDVHWLLDGRAHVILSPHGRCSHLVVNSGSGDVEYVDRNTPDPRAQWRRAMRAIERFYEPDEDRD